MLIILLIYIFAILLLQLVYLTVYNYIFNSNDRHMDLQEVRISITKRNKSIMANLFYFSLLVLYFFSFLAYLFHLFFDYFSLVVPFKIKLYHFSTFFRKVHITHEKYQIIILIILVIMHHTNCIIPIMIVIVTITPITIID